MSNKSQLDEFRNMIDNCNDPEMLSVAQTLLSELLEINQLKNRLNNLESGLTEGKKAMFFFFTSGLEEDEIVYAAERVRGKSSRLEEKMKRENELKKAEEDKLKKE
jgi:hypothetical protein